MEAEFHRYVLDAETRLLLSHHNRVFHGRVHEVTSLFVNTTNSVSLNISNLSNNSKNAKTPDSSDSSDSSNKLHKA